METDEFVDAVMRNFPNRWVAIKKWTNYSLDASSTCSARTLEELTRHLSGSPEMQEVIIIIAPHRVRTSPRSHHSI